MTNRTTRHALTTLIIGLLVAACVTVLSPPPQASAGSTVKTAAREACTHPKPDVLQFNVAGNTIYKGDLKAANDVVASVTNTCREPKIVTLNEVCKRQFDRIANTLSAGPPSWVGEFTATATGVSRCGGNEEYGIALFSRNALFSRETACVSDADLKCPNLSSEKRKISCYLTQFLNDSTRVCVTHIISGNTETIEDLRWDQIRRVEEFVDAFSRPVVIGGDFNEPPEDNAMDHMFDVSAYGDGAHGEFQEVDCPTLRTNSCGDATHSGDKIDYIFATKVDFANFDAFVTGPTSTDPHSDHNLLWGLMSRE